jgi:L-fuconolactonase
VEYDWIDEEMRAIRRDFLPGDLLEEINKAGIDGVISVQARQTLGETEWLLQLARENDFIKGVVGWVPLIDEGVEKHLAQYAAEPKLRAVRHVLQGERDEFYMLRQDFNAGIRALGQFGLVYDILIFERHLPQTIEFVDRHPNQIFVLDHIAKPRIKEGITEPWSGNLCKLAQRENVFCKISGMATEAGYSTWSEAQLRPYFDKVLEAFGPSRTMFASDWPVCLVACGYTRWAGTVENMASRFSISERAALFGGTAARAYRLAG